MKAIKILVPFLAIGIVIGIFLTLFPAAETYFERAYFEIESKNYLTAEQILNKLESEHPKKWNNLYRAYFFSSQNDFGKAFREAEKCLQKGQAKTPQELHETYLNLAAYSYLQHKNEDFHYYFSHAKSINSEDSFCMMLQGLEFFLQGDYVNAVSTWDCRNLPSSSFQPDPLWKKRFLESLFNQSWLNLHIAYCLIETEHFFEARELLEKENHSISSQSNAQNFLLGMSYVKEASKNEISKRIPYYKLARFYLDYADDKIPYFEMGSQQSHKVFNENAYHLANQMDECSEELLPYLCESLFFFIQYLEKWDESPTLDHIAFLIAEKMRLLIESHHYPTAKKIALALQHRFNEGLFLDKLVSYLVLNIKESIEMDSQTHLTALWDLTETLSFPRMEVEKKVAAELIHKIYSEIESKEFCLPKIILYISLWSNIEKNPDNRQHFNYELMHGAELLWRSEGSEKKATSLMEVCFSLASENEKIILFQRTKNYLTALYRLAKEANTVRRLALIFDAMDQLHIDHQELIDREKVANHLADAHYLFFAEHFPSALSNAEWVLKLDPNNQQALWIMGLSCFYEGDYVRAQEILALLSHPDERALKALTLCQLFKSEHFEKELAAQIESTFLGD